MIPNHKIPGYADGAGSAPGGEGNIRVQVYLDGEEMRSAMVKATFDDNFRNGNRINGGRPAGNLRPR